VINNQEEILARTSYESSGLYLLDIKNSRDSVCVILKNLEISVFEEIQHFSEKYST